MPSSWASPAGLEPDPIPSGAAFSPALQPATLPDCPPLFPGQAGGPESDTLLPQTLTPRSLPPEKRGTPGNFSSFSGALGSNPVADDLIAPSSPALAPSSLFVVSDSAGNTLSTARNIGTLTSSQAFTDWVGSTDTNDYYRFSLGQASNFSLALTGLSADADVQLLNSAGGTLASSVRGGTSAESISSSLAAGNYFVRVYPYSGNTTYTLALSATPTTPEDNAGNTLAAARNIGTLTSSQTFSDWVGSADTNDYYRFDLAQAANVSLSLNGLSDNADVQLLNNSGV
ncbi:MAG: pre-peptidase C-terminal domain-containing protein, partial [Cyanobacteriota bacterium]